MRGFQLKSKFLCTIGTFAVCALAGTAWAVTRDGSPAGYAVTASADDDGMAVFSIGLDTRADFDQCTVIRNTAGNWTFYSYGPYVRYSIYAFDGVASDDYIVIPDVELAAGNEYAISVDGCKEASNDAFVATLEFCYGTAAEVASLTGVSTSEITTSGFAAYKSGRFSVPATGTYCIALHANSPKMDATAGYCEMHVKNLAVIEYEGGGEVVIPPAVPDKEEIFSMPFASESEFTSCAVIDNNEDNSSWKYYRYGPYVRYSAWLENRTDADDYLVLPAMQLEPGREYEVSAEAMRGDDRWAETLAFCYGAAAEAASMKEVSRADITATSFAPVQSARFKVNVAGTYYIALKAASPAIDSNIGQHELAVKNVKVTAYAVSGGDDNPVAGLPIPFSVVPTPEELEQLVIIDYNEDEYDRGLFQLGVWNYDSSDQSLVYIYSNSGKDADDYVVLPKLHFADTEHAYTVSLDAKVASSRNPESFEVYVGSTMNPEEMTLLYSSSEITNDDAWVTHSFPMGVKEAGDYYVAVKATSRKDQFKLMVKNISVALSGTSVNLPSKPADVSVTAGAKGTLKAGVTFTVPQFNIAGNQLQGEVSVKVASSVDEKIITGQPGETKTVEVATVQGANTISVSAFNVNGAGESVFANIYTGVDMPRIPVAKATVSEDNMSLHIEWAADEQGVNGGYVDPAAVIYTVSRYDVDDKTYDDGVKLTGEFSYDYTSEAGAPLHEERFMITAENIAGRDAGYAGVRGIVGTPFSLPMDENLENGKLAYNALSTDTPTDAYLYAADFRLYDLTAIFETPDANYANITEKCEKAIWAFIRYGEPGSGRFVFPKFSTEGIAEVKFKMNVFVNSIFPETDVYATTYGVEPVKIGSISSESGNGWTDMAFTLPASFGGKKWVSVYFDAEFTDIDAQNIFISSYTVSELLGNDLAVIALDGPDDAVNVGDKAEYTATVQNAGKNVTAIPAVIFEVVDADNHVIATERVQLQIDMLLMPEQTVGVGYSIDASADILGEYTVRAYVDVEDENPANDYCELVLAIIKGQKPIVDDLTATSGTVDGTIDLAWSKPDIKLNGFDDFEDYAPFHYGKYIGLFKNVDGDKKATYSYDQCVFDAATKPKAFMVVNPEYLNNRLVQENYTPRSGKQYLVAFCPKDGSKADDWLISPEVQPGTVISFFVSVVGLNQFAERYDVCYSSTTNDPAAFTVLESCTAADMKWQGKAFILPDDARYFAIHYVSSDVFGIMLDDIDYTPVINEKSKFTYNVYADDELVAENLSETAFSHTGLELRDYRYNVTTVVDGTEYNYSNTAVASSLSGVDGVTAAEKSIAVAGSSVVIAGYAGETVAVYGIDGRCIYAEDGCADHVSVTLRSGVYVVKAGSDSVKVIVNN